MIITWSDELGRMVWKEEEAVFPYTGPQPNEEPAEEATVGELDDIAVIASDPVLTWRAKRLVDNGMIPAQARSLALDRTVDVTWVVERLLKRDCPPDTAFLIASGVMAA